MSSGIVNLKNEKASRWATIISGQPRAKLEEPKEEYEVFVSGLDKVPDMFGHMWECGELLSGWGERGWLGAAGKMGTTKVFHSKRSLEVWDLHAFLVEDYDNLSFQYLPKSNNIQQGTSQWYGINKAFQVMEWFEENVSKEYDFVMRYRYDLEFAPHNQHNQPNWKLIEEMLTEDKKLIIGDAATSYNGFGDMVAMGSREAMKRYSNFCNYFVDIRPNHPNNEEATEYYLKTICGLNLKSPWNLDIGIHR